MSDPDSRGRLYAATWLTALLAAGIWLRLRGLGEYYFSPDELGVLAIAKSQSLKEIFDYSRLETNPPFLYILRHYILQLGDSAEIMRLPSVIAGLLCIPVYYALGKQQGGRFAGAVATLLITFSYGCVQQSQLVRNYTMITLFIGLAFYYYRAFCQTHSLSALLGYAVAGTLALMTHHTAVFAPFCMGVAGMIYCRKSKRALYAWMAANAFLALYFCWNYVVYVLENPEYQSVLRDARTAAMVPPYNTLNFRLTLLAAYIPATISYLLHSTFFNQINMPSVCLYFIALGFTPPDKRGLCYESLFALTFGGLLVACNLYPYAFRIAGRHAMWALPYVILPVSVGVGIIAEKCADCLRSEAKSAAALVAGGIALAVGFILDTPDVFFSDPRDYLLTNAQMRELRTQLAGFGSKDIIITGGVNVLYLLPDITHYYRDQLKRDEWHHSDRASDTRILYSVIAPVINGVVLNERQYMARLDEEGTFNGVDTVWFFHTPWDVLNAKALARCKGAGVQVHDYTNPAGGEEAGPAAELIGVPRDVLLHDMVPSDGKFAACL